MSKELDEEIKNLYLFKEFAILMFDMFDFEYNKPSETLRLIDTYNNEFLIFIENESADIILKTAELLESENGVV